MCLSVKQSWMHLCCCALLTRVTGPRTSWVAVSAASVNLSYHPTHPQPPMQPLPPSCPFLQSLAQQPFPREHARAHTHMHTQTLTTYLLTYAHRSQWSIGHQRPPAIALCSGLLLSFRTSWSPAVSALLQCLASNCCEAGLSSSSPAGSRSGLGVWCWMLAF